MSRILMMSVLLSLVACQSDEDKSEDDTPDDGGADGADGADGGADGADGADGGDDEHAGIPALGSGTHDLASVSLTTHATDDDGLREPRDLAFNPEADGELWVVNKRDDSVVLLFDAGTDGQTTDKIIDPYALHFMDAPSSIDFGAPGTFGTCQESRNTYNGGGRPNEFMGPSLWSSDLAVFGTSNPEAVEYLSDLYGFAVDLGSHLDMLHESPLCMGMAWDFDNVYWVFDGYHETIVRYDFAVDHGVGYDDHSDGIIHTYAEGEVSYEEGVPSHIEIDQDARLLYIADSGNQRIAIMDLESGEEGSRIRPQEPGTTYVQYDDADIWTFIDGGDAGFSSVSGLELAGGYLFASDNASGTIIAFDMDGNEVDRLETGLAPGALMGLAVVSLDEIWFTDAIENTVHRLTPAE